MESLRNYTAFEHIEKRMTYSDIYNWGPVVTIKDREMFSLKVANVAPARECATFVNCTKTVLRSQQVWRWIAPPPLTYLMLTLLLNCQQDGFWHVEGLSMPMSQQTALGDHAVCEDCVYAPETPPDRGSAGPLPYTRLYQWLTPFSPAEYVSLTIFVMPTVVTFECRNKQISLCCGGRFECHLASHQCH